MMTFPRRGASPGGSIPARADPARGFAASPPGPLSGKRRGGVRMRRRMFPRAMTCGWRADTPIPTEIPFLDLRSFRVHRSPESE